VSLRVLDDVAFVASGNTPSKQSAQFWEGDLPWISAASMHGIYANKSDRKLTASGRVHAKLAQAGDILILTRGSMLYKRIPVCLVDREIAFNQDVKRLRPKTGVDQNYLFQALVANEHYLLSRVVGTGIGAGKLATDTLMQTTLVIPSLSEQKKIAAFMSAVDEKLAAVEAQLAGWRDYKRGMMQALFSQTLRFKADDGSDFPDWKETNLNKLAKFEKGRGISKSDISVNGTAPCIRYGELYTTYGNVIEEVISMTNYPPNNPIMSSGNDVIIPSSGETAEDIATASAVLVENVILGGDLNVIRTEENAHFLAALLSNKYRLELAKLAQGNSVVHLYSKDMKGLKIEIPSLPEQKKIADALSSIDAKIDALTSRLRATQEFKRGLLQKMFV